MNMRVPPSSSSRYQSSQTGNSTTPQDLPNNSAAGTPSAKANQMREALNNYILNNAINAINDMQKKANKTEQAHKKNVSKQKERKAQEEE